MNKPTDYQKGIPGVPLSALNAIQDPNTRQVVKAIVDGWHVRNGSSGDGKNRFVTADELGTVSANASSALNAVNQWNAGGGGNNNGKVLTKGEINRIITDLEASVMESLLWKHLGTRIKIIEVDTEGNAAEIRDEVIKRLNDDNALVSAVNTMWAQIGDNQGLIQRGGQVLVNNAGAVAKQWNQVQATIRDADGNLISSAAVRQEASAALTKAGDIETKWSVKTDINGYVAGFGLIGTANNSTPRFDFIVRADRFAIGSPEGPTNPDGSPSVTPTVPFIVLTTPDDKGNQPGVYMRNTMIANAAIGTAQIDDLSVNTLKIAGEAITRTQMGQSHFSEVLFDTTPWSIEAPPGGGISPVTYDQSYWRGISSVDISVPADALTTGRPVRVAITCIANLYPIDGSTASFVLGIAYSAYAGHLSLINQWGAATTGGNAIGITGLAYFDILTPGTHTFIIGGRLQAGPTGAWSPPGGKVFSGIGSMLVQGAFR